MNSCSCQEAETFWTLVTSAAHWELELLIMVVVDGLALGAALPFIRRHWSHHLAHDKAHPETSSTPASCGFPGCRCPYEYPGHTHHTNNPDEIFP